MKIKYFYKDGKIEVIDDTDLDNNKIYDYQDNINDIFELENIQEFLEREKTNILLNIKTKEKNIKKVKEQNNTNLALYTTFSLFSSTFLVLNLFYPILFIILFTVGYSISYINNKQEIKTLTKVINGNKAKIKIINTKLDNIKIRLKELYKDNKKTKEKEDKIKIGLYYVFIREELQGIKKELEQHYKENYENKDNIKKLLKTK